MKVLVLASSKEAIPCLQYLYSADMLAGIICPGRDSEDVRMIVSDQYDDGPIVTSARVAMVPGETGGLLSGRLSQISVNLIKTFLQNLLSSADLSLTDECTDSSYFRRLNAKDIKILFLQNNNYLIQNPISIRV